MMIQFGKEIANERKHLPFLLKASEENNCVQFTVALSLVGEKGNVEPSGFAEFDKILANTAPITPDMKHVYRITFEDSLLHLTRSESYGQDDPSYDIMHGNHFLIFERSRLLDMLPQLIWPDPSFFPTPWKHYGIRCQDHFIDVISCCEPIIEKVSL